MTMITRRQLVSGLGAAAWGLPAGSGPVRAAVGALTLREIAPGVHVAQGRQELFNAENAGFISNLTVIFGSEGIAVVDTGGSMAVGRALLAAIGRISRLPVKVVINTHMHPDHIFGNAAFVETGCVFAGNAKLPRALAARGERYLAANKGDLGGAAFAGTRIIAPTLLVEDRHSLDLGGRALTLTARKTAHTDNDLTVRDEVTGTLILGDLLFSGHIPVVDGSLKGWLRLMDELALEKAERVVPGHGQPGLPWPQALDDQRRYLETLARDVRAVIKAGGTLEQALKSAGESERARWLLFDDFHGRNITAAFAELEWE